MNPRLLNWFLIPNCTLHQSYGTNILYIPDTEPVTDCTQISLIQQRWLMDRM